MNQEGTVRGPGGDITAVALLPPTAVLALIVWGALQSDSLVAMIGDLKLAFGSIGIAVLYVLGLFTVVSGRMPSSRSSQACESPRCPGLRTTRASCRSLRSLGRAGQRPPRQHSLGVKEK